MTGSAELLPYATPAARAAVHDRLADHLSGGGMVVYPTETVYGLGCALVPEALVRLASWKRGKEGESSLDAGIRRPFLLLVRGPGDVAGLTWTRDARILADRFWPGPLTLALPADSTVLPPQVVGPEGTVALRVSSHPGVAALLEAAEGPITSTSANPPGGTPASAAEDAARAVDGLDDVLVLDGGPLPDAAPSTIVRCDDDNTVLREGAVPGSALEAVVELA